MTNSGETQKNEQGERLGPERVCLICDSCQEIVCFEDEYPREIAKKILQSGWYLEYIGSETQQPSTQHLLGEWIPNAVTAHTFRVFCPECFIDRLREAT